VTALNGLRSQLDENYVVHSIDMGKSPKVQDVAAECRSVNAAALVLMDAKAIKMARELQRLDSGYIVMPKFVFMTLMVESMTKGLFNVVGVKFEIPLYTLVVNFRIISQKDFSTIGIFYRRPFAAFIGESKGLLEKEGIRINAECIDCDAKQSVTDQIALGIMEKSFSGMIKDDRVEAFVITADDRILNAASMKGFWIEKVKKRKIPGIAPIDVLATDRYAVAVFSVGPDIPQVGVQAANQVIDYFDNRTPLEKIGFEPTISVKSTLNLKMAREIGWKLKEEKLGRITTIIGK
jgi:ABC-type uncharacterized transport system substrate-binding protein